MDTQYEDYYSPYKETHEKVDNAYDLACSHGVSKNLQENIANATEKIGRCKIGGENDNVIASYNEVVNSYLERLNNLYVFATSYFDVESVYCDLALELDELEEYDSQFKAISQQQPQKSNYEKKDENNKEYTDPQYDIDLYNWKKEVLNYKKCCQALAENVRNYLIYISSVDSFNPKDGKIQVSVDRPSYLVGGELLNKYSNEPISGEEMLDDRDIYTRLSDYGYTNVRKLEGEELETYCKAHSIGLPEEIDTGHYERNEDGESVWVDTGKISKAEAYERFDIDIDVYTCERIVNGVTYSFAFAYDNNKSEAYHREFEDEMEKCVEQMYLIPDYCHKQLKEKGVTTVVLEESPACDSWARINDSTLETTAGGRGGGDFVQAYYFPSGRTGDHGVFLHELGHQFDYNPDLFNRCSESETWLNLTADETNSYMDEFADGYHKFDDWNAFSDNEKKTKSCEFFAECFRRYWSANDRLKSVCPETYAELERIMQETEEKYQ